MNSPRRFEVWLVRLDPAEGSEMRKTRPCLVVSPDEINRHLRTMIVAPMTTVVRSYPTRVRVRLQGKDGDVALDQMRAVDRARLLRRVEVLSKAAARRVSQVLVEMFTFE